MKCAHGFAKASQCVDCMLDGPVDDNRWRKIGSPFTSKYPGKCGACGDAIESGVLTQRWDLGDPARQTSYTHVGCHEPT